MNEKRTDSVEREHEAILNALLEPHIAAWHLDREFSDAECSLLAGAILSATADGWIDIRGMLLDLMTVRPGESVETSMARMEVTRPDGQWFAALLERTQQTCDT